jgi:hypothetical protein
MFSLPQASSKVLKSSTALAIAVGMTTTAFLPLTTLQANAQSRPITVAQSNSKPALFNRTVRIPSGTVIPAAYTKAEKIVLAPDEKASINLTVPNNIRTIDGRLLIPAGSTVEGEFRPATIVVRDDRGNNKDEKGSQFYARTLVMPNGSRMSLDATSDVITKKEKISKGVNTDAILKGAAIGGGAAAIISGVTGNRRITLGKVLIGAGAGALGGFIFAGQRKDEVVVIDADSDLSLRLNSAIAFNTSL